MGHLFYNEEGLEFRRKLRVNMTPAEVVLWNYLKGDQLMDLRFRRQASIGKYIVDFYCPQAKLVVEVDGNVHLGEEAQIHDQERDEYLKTLGLKVVRVTNVDVMGNMQGVGQRIIEAAKQTDEKYV